MTGKSVFAFAVGRLLFCETFACSFNALFALFSFVMFRDASIFNVWFGWLLVR